MNDVSRIRTVEKMCCPARKRHNKEKTPNSQNRKFTVIFIYVIY